MMKGLYRLNIVPLKPHREYNFNSIIIPVCPSISSILALSCNKKPIDLWHFRLVHPSYERLLLLKQFYVVFTSDKQFICETCHHSKQKRLSFPNSDSHSSCAFALIHIDIWGPCNVTSLNGYQYFLTIVYDYSRFVWVFLMNSKAKTQSPLVPSSVVLFSPRCFFISHLHFS